MGHDLPYPEKVSLEYLFKKLWFRNDWLEADFAKKSELYLEALTLLYDYHKRQDFKLKYWTSIYNFTSHNSADVGLLALAKASKFKRRKSYDEIVSEYGEPIPFDDERWYEQASITSSNVILKSFSIYFETKPYLDLRFKKITVLHNQQEWTPCEEEISLSWSQIFIPDYQVIKFEQYNKINGRTMPKLSEPEESKNGRLLENEHYKLGHPENPVTKKREESLKNRREAVQKIYNVNHETWSKKNKGECANAIIRRIQKPPYNITEGISKKTITRDLEALFPEEFPVRSNNNA